MAEIKIEDIFGYLKGENLYCPDCAEKEDLKDFSFRDILSRNEVESEETLYFCDICEKQL